MIARARPDGVPGSKDRRPAHDACRRRRPTQITAAAPRPASSFYAAMRILPRAQRQAMFQIYSFCRQVDDIADSTGRGRSGWPRCSNGATISMRSMHGHPPARLQDYVASVKTFGLKREDFLAIVDGMEMDVPQDIRAPDLRDARSLLRPRRRARSAACRCACSACPRTTASSSRIISAARCSSPTSCATSTRTPDLGRLYLPREWLWPPASPTTIRARVIADRALPKVCAPLAERAKQAFRSPTRSWSAIRAPCVRAADHVEILPRDPRSADRAQAFAAPRAGACVQKAAKIAILLRYAII